MKKLVIFSVTALTAAVMSGVPALTSQAAVYTYRAPSSMSYGGNGRSAGNAWDASCNSGSGWNSSRSNGNQVLGGAEDCDQPFCDVFDGTQDGPLLNPIKPQAGEVLRGLTWNDGQTGGGQNKPDQPGTGDQNKPDQPGNGDQNKPDQPGNGDQNKPDQPGNGDQNKPNRPELPDDEQDPSLPGDVDSYVEAVLELVNEERAKAGAQALTLDAKAGEAAELRAQEIQSSFSHTRPDGSSFSTALTEAGVRYSAAGENIAYGQNSPEEVMNSWMNSSGHRANILNSNFTSIGIGHERVNGVDYWTQLFFR